MWVVSSVGTRVVRTFFPGFSKDSPGIGLGPGLYLQQRNLAPSSRRSVWLTSVASC